MTYESSNSKEIESLETSELVSRIKTAMTQGCIHPSHVYDMVDEALVRLCDIESKLDKVESDFSELYKVYLSMTEATKSEAHT